MASPPRLTRAQLRLIQNDLPPTRRDPTMIAALLYRATSGQSLRETSQVFGVCGRDCTNGNARWRAACRMFCANCGLHRHRLPCRGAAGKAGNESPRFMQA